MFLQCFLLSKSSLLQSHLPVFPPFLPFHLCVSLITQFSFLPADHQEAHIKVSSIALPLSPCWLPPWGHVFFCFDTLTAFMSLSIHVSVCWSLSHTHTSFTLVTPIHTQTSTNKVTHQLFLLSHEDMRPHIPLTFFHHLCRQSKRMMATSANLTMISNAECFEYKQWLKSWFLFSLHFFSPPTSLNLQSTTHTHHFP